MHALKTKLYKWKADRKARTYFGHRRKKSHVKKQQREQKREKSEWEGMKMKLANLIFFSGERVKYFFILGFRCDVTVSRYDFTNSSSLV